MRRQKINCYTILAAVAFSILFLYSIHYKIVLTKCISKLNILFTIPLNMFRHDTPTVLVQVL